jgi:hypothetical protein
MGQVIVEPKTGDSEGDSFGDSCQMINNYCWNTDRIGLWKETHYSVKEEPSQDAQNDDPWKGLKVQFAAAYEGCGTW